MSGGGFEFVGELVARAIKASFSDLGTNALGWSFGVAVPFVVLFSRAIRATNGKKLDLIRTQWKTEIRDTFLFYCVVWLLTFAFEFFWKQPGNIWRIAQSTPSPNLQNRDPHPPNSAYSLSHTKLIRLQPTETEKQEPLAQDAYSEAIENIRPSVVQIKVGLINPQDAYSSKMPADLEPIFHEAKTFIAGTGFFINDDGDVLTAADVVVDMGKIGNRLQTAGIESRPFIGFVGANVDSPGFVRNDVTSLSAGISFVDPQVDIAVLHLFMLPTGAQSILGVHNLDRPKPVMFDNAKPKEGVEVFIRGFPFGSMDAVNTSGTIASSESFEPLLFAQANGFQGPQDLYKVDARLSPGNSGGPLFRKSNQSVLGVMVEVTNSGGYAIAVPSKEVTDSLSKHKIRWVSAPR